MRTSSKTPLSVSLTGCLPGETNTQVVVSYCLSAQSDIQGFSGPTEASTTRPTTLFRPTAPLQAPAPRPSPLPRSQPSPKTPPPATTETGEKSAMMGCSSLTCSAIVLTLILTLTLTSLGHLPITARADPGVVQARFTSQDRQCPGRVVSQDSCPVAMTAARVTRCASFCGRREWCLSWLLDANSGLCHLCEVTASSDCSNTVERTAGRRGWDVVKQCENGGQWVNGECQCPHGFGGDLCQTRMEDCSDWATVRSDTQDGGTEWIFPTMTPDPFLVSCSASYSRTVLLVYRERTVSFRRGWQDYVNGFGDVSGDHWLGLPRLHQLTTSRCYQMTLGFQVSGAIYNTSYGPSQVSDEADNFSLSFNATGSTTACLNDVMGQPFSTYDADHDDVAENCADRRGYGWWFSECSTCNEAEGGRLEEAQLYIFGC